MGQKSENPVGRRNVGMSECIPLDLTKTKISEASAASFRAKLIPSRSAGGIQYLKLLRGNLKYLRVLYVWDFRDEPWEIRDEPWEIRDMGWEIRDMGWENRDMGLPAGESL